MEMEILDLTVDNAFDFCAVLDAVGVDNAIGVFNKDEINALREGGKAIKDIGMLLAMKAAGVLVKHLSAAREPVYVFLAGCTVWKNGHPVTADDLRKLKLGAFVRLIKQFAAKEDIVDFFSEVAGLVGMEQTGSENSSTEDMQPPATTLTKPPGVDA